MKNLCPQCHYENRETARFCGECGAALDMEPQPPHLVGLLLRRQTRHGPGARHTHRRALLCYRRKTSAAGQLVYTVEDRGICRACGAEAIAADDEPYCSNCGAQLLQMSSPWPMCELAESTAVNGDPHVTWQGRTFAVVAEVVRDSVEDTEPEDTQSASPGPTGEGAGNRPFGYARYLLVGQRSDVGDARRGQANEDSLFVLTTTAISSSQAGPTLGLYLVADGMGGHMDGEIASRTACEVIIGTLLATLGLPTLEHYSSATVQERIEGAFQVANHQIFAIASADGSNMGTTAVLALVVDDQAYLANVGDSRAYRWRAGELRQLTEDHSHVYTLFKNGLIEEDAIYIHPRRNEIFRSLGSAPAVEVDCYGADLAPGDLLLLCSDGLWEMLRSEGIADVLELNLADPQVICDELVRRANLAGGDDNISVIVVRAIG